MNRFWTIRNRFLVFGLLSLLPLIGFIWLLVSNHNSTRYQDQVAAQTSMASQVSGSLVSYLTNNFRAMEGIAANPVVVEGTEPDDITNILGQARSVRPDYMGMFVTDTEGNIVSQAGIVDPNVLPEISGQVENVLATGQRSVSGRIDLPLDPPTSVFVMLVPISSVPETSNGDASTEVSTDESTSATPTPQLETAGTVRGVMGIVIPTDTINQFALPSTRNRTEIVVISGEQIIAGTGDVRGNEPAFMQNLLAQNAVISEEGSDVFRMQSVLGTERSAVWTPLAMDSTNWTVLVTTPVPSNQFVDLWEQLLALFLVAGLVYLVISYTFG